jgi:phosphonate transport system ATP-binding protein
VITVRGLGKEYPPSTRALVGIDLAVAPGEFLVIIGPSGSGKSTFLRCLNRLVEPSAGQVFLDGTEVTGAGPEALRQIRRSVGMIFQQFNLIKRATVLENVLAGRLGYVGGVGPLLGRFPAADEALALDCLGQVGLGDFAERRADTLSGGEQQRVAIARALAQRPRVILADEPTASLDMRLGKVVMDILKQINAARGITLIVSHHLLETARTYARRIVGLRAGRIVYDGPPGGIGADAIARIYGADEAPR